MRLSAHCTKEQVMMMRLLHRRAALAADAHDGGRPYGKAGERFERY
ncbi:hypothetical protein [Paenibacillus fonticola]|nr:hypothetical protein [Paenibacillus fonticola]